MAKQHNLFTANRTQILDESRNVLNVVLQVRHAESRKGAPHSNLKNRIVQVVGFLNIFGHGSRIRYRVRAIKQTANEEDGVLGRV